VPLIPEREEIFVRIGLTMDEALVLSDWIDGLDTGTELVDDDAVWVPLLRIGGALEATLPQIFAPDYGEQLEAARRRLLAKKASRPRIVDPIPAS
jgi:hypothetical protein